MSEIRITTVQEPDMQGMPRTYTSQRTCATETPLPVRGAALGDIYGVYKLNIVLSATRTMGKNVQMQTVTHCLPPTSGSGWTSLYGSNTLPDVNLSVAYAQQVVLNPTSGEVDDSPLVEYTPINEALSQKKTTVSPKAALLLIHHVFPTTENVNLPDTMISAGVNVTRTLGNGNGMSSGSGASLSMRSSVQLAADLHYEIKEGYRGPVPGEVHVFFLDLTTVTTAAILAKISAKVGATVNLWPVFQPKSSRITIAGHGLSKNYDYSSSNESVSASEGANVEAFSNVAVFPATLHAALDLTPTYDDFEAPHTWVADIYDQTAARAQAVIDGIYANVSAGNGTYWGISAATEEGKTALLAIIDELQSQVTFESDLVASDFTVAVSPSTLTATTPAAITAGKYLLDSSVSLYGYGCVKVTAAIADLTTVV